VKFGSISAEDIERLRLKHRLAVVQNIEDTTMKNVIRSISCEQYFTLDELQHLYLAVKEEQLASQSWGYSVNSLDPIQKYDPTLPFYELYRVDFEQFNGLFHFLSPWGIGQNGSILAHRLFAFLDENRDNYINFKELVLGLALTGRAELEDRLKMFYAVHLCPSQGPEDVSTPSSGETEVATEASDYFEDSVASQILFPHDVSNPSMLSKDCLIHKRIDSETSDGSREVIGPEDVDRVRSYIFGEKSKSSTMPCLDQDQFITMWKTLYDFFVDHSEEEQLQLYHSIATVGTLLLQIGEVGRQFPTRREDPRNGPVDDLECPIDSKPCTEERSTSDDETLKSRDMAWSITFEQFLANVTTETPLASFFEMKIDLFKAVEKLRNRRLIRQSSISIAPPSPSPSTSSSVRI